MTRLELAVVSTVVGLGCAHAPPRGPVATTKNGLAPAPGHCDEAEAPYLAELCGMGEPPLSASGPESYRFVWMRHLRNPVAVRVSRIGDGADAGVAVVAIEGDARDPAAGRRHELAAGGETWAALQAHLQAADFWHLPGDPAEGERGLDGADWVLEGRRGGLDHAVIRWEPKAGPFRAACEDLIEVAGLTFPAELR